MYVEPEVVGGAVHEVFFIGGFFGVLVVDVLLGEEAELEEFAFDEGADAFFVITERDAGAEELGSLAQDAEDSFVDLTLTWGECAIDGYATGDVGSVVGVFGAEVEEEDIAVLALLGVVGIVEHTGIVS